MVVNTNFQSILRTKASKLWYMDKKVYKCRACVGKESQEDYFTSVAYNFVI